VVIVPFQSFADSSHTGIVQRDIKCMQRHMHLVQSACWQQSAALFNELRKQKLIHKFNCSLQQHFH